jgi:hypothetical protein
MNKICRLITILVVLALPAATVQAALVASIHVDNSITDAVNVDVAGPLAARDTSGNANTIGTLSGAVNFLAASPGESVSDISGFSATSQFRDLNRFGGNANGGSVVTWDFDFSGQSSPEWQFNIDLTAEGGKPADHTLGFYISYNDGGSLSLDTTDIKGETPGADALVVSNSVEYVSLLPLNPDATSIATSIDITSVVNTAIANGGGIRIAMVDNTFQNTIAFQNDSGIVAVPEPAQFALLFGVGTLGFVLLRRRLKQTT